MPVFPLTVTIPQIISTSPTIPTDVEVGDFIVGRYKTSQWADRLPWEAWHHAALIVNTDPLEIVEASGINTFGEHPGPTRKLFADAALWGASDELVAMKWCKPVFPNPIREIAPQEIKRSERDIITEKEARTRAVTYALEQADNNEPYSIAATKWNENAWYCSLLIYKSYSRTVTDMYLESYPWYDKNGTLLTSETRSGPYVTPEDLVDSRRSKTYHSWKKGEYAVPLEVVSA